MRKTLKTYVSAFILLIVSYLTLLLAAYAIPNRLVQDNAQLSLDFLALEGESPQYTFFSDAARTDNYSDIIIYQEVLRDEERSVLYNAMDNRDYARYWHGHNVYMRPLSVFFNILQVRYLLMGTFYALLAATVYHVYRTFGCRTAVPFVVGLIMIYPNTVSTCLHLAAVFIVTLIFANVLLRTYKKHPERTALLFFLCGSVTNFFDLLTIPLLSFGLPLLFVLLMNREALKEQLLLACRLGIAWGLGYGGTWAAKWVLATAVLRRNVIADALRTAAYRIDGREDWFEINHPFMFRRNLTNILPPFPMELNLLLLGALLLLALWFLAKSAAARSRMRELCILLPVAALPYLWYAVLLNHSCIHAFFTYRLQLITVAALGTCFFELLCAFRAERRAAAPKLPSSQERTDRT